MPRLRTHPAEAGKQRFCVAISPTPLTRGNTLLSVTSDRPGPLTPLTITPRSWGPLRTFQTELMIEPLTPHPWGTRHAAIQDGAIWPFTRHAPEHHDYMGELGGIVRSPRLRGKTRHQHDYPHFMTVHPADAEKTREFASGDVSVSVTPRSRGKLSLFVKSPKTITLTPALASGEPRPELGGVLDVGPLTPRSRANTPCNWQKRQLWSAHPRIRGEK